MNRAEQELPPTGVQHYVYVEANEKIVLVKLEKLHVYIKAPFTLFAIYCMFLPEAKMVLFTSLLFIPYIAIRIVLILVSKWLSFTQIEKVRGIIYCIEAFTALTLFTLQYIAHVDVLPSMDYFLGKGFISLAFGSLIAFFFFHSVLGLLFILYFLTHIYLCVTGNKVRTSVRDQRRSSQHYWDEIEDDMSVDIQEAPDMFDQPEAQPRSRLADLSRVFDRQLFEKHKECTICLNEFKENDLVSPLPCDTRHYFHSSCIERWFN